MLLVDREWPETAHEETCLEALEIAWELAYGSHSGPSETVKVSLVTKASGDKICVNAKGVSCDKELRVDVLTRFARTTI